jgi:hypothetical protein
MLTKKMTDRKGAMTMRTATASSLAAVLVIGVMAAANAASTCGPDAVVVGPMCLDRYEASVWRVPNPTTTNASLVTKITLGTATQADLMAGGATPLGTAGDDYAPCTNDGQNCANDIYAVSLASEIPSANITWFQAQEACANAGKRLPTSAEWQVGADGTPDPGPDNRATDCNSATNVAVATGSRSACRSALGAFDMAGNLDEWVAEWVPLSTTCPGWGFSSNDRMCLAGASTAIGGPGALTRGGAFVDGPGAGPLAVVGGRRPSFSSGLVGFRCAHPASEPAPAEVDNGFRVSRSGTDALLAWNVADGATASQVLRGHVSGLPVGPGGADEQCLVENSELGTLTDSEIPVSGDGFWYLVRGENVSGAGPYGFESLRGAPAAPRVSATCP